MTRVPCSAAAWGLGWVRGWEARISLPPQFGVVGPPLPSSEDRSASSWGCRGWAGPSLGSRERTHFSAPPPQGKRNTNPPPTQGGGTRAPPPAAAWTHPGRQGAEPAHPRPASPSPACAPSPLAAPPTPGSSPVAPIPLPSPPAPGGRTTSIPSPFQGRVRRARRTHPRAWAGGVLGSAGILELRRGSQPSPWVGPGKPNLPLGLRGNAGGGARVTTGYE